MNELNSAEKKAKVEAELEQEDQLKSLYFRQEITLRTEWNKYLVPKFDEWLENAISGHELGVNENNQLKVAAACGIERFIRELFDYFQNAGKEIELIRKQQREKKKENQDGTG